MAAIPRNCDCGGPMETFGSYAYSHGPKFVPEGAACGECGRSDEQIADEHDAAHCAPKECGWCALIQEEAAG